MLHVVHSHYISKAAHILYTFFLNYRESDIQVMDSIGKMRIIPFCDHLFRQLIVPYSSYSFVFKEETEVPAAGTT